MPGIEQHWERCLVLKLGVRVLNCFLVQVASKDPCDYNFPIPSSSQPENVSHEDLILLLWSCY